MHTSNRHTTLSEELLPTEPFSVIHLTEVDSTNQWLNTWCDSHRLPEGTTLQTDFQTAGKGQRGNSWEAARGKNLLFSVVLYPTFLEARRQFILSQLISLAIQEELSTYTSNITIKWPNDIYWKDQKICGILIENSLSGMNLDRCIIGIGLNINQELFVSDAPNPVSLKQITGRTYDRSTLLQHILVRIRQDYQALQRGETEAIVRRYFQALYRNEGLHPFSDADGPFLARIADVEADGHLVLEDDNGLLRRYVFKEVQYLL